MTKKLMLLAAGALAALAFAALPAGASAEEMQAHCSAPPCEGVVEGTGNVALSSDNGLTVVCTKTTGTVTQSAATSSTVSVALTFDECGGFCTGLTATNTLTGHLITLTKGNPNTAAILLTEFAVECFGIKHALTGDLIGTIENPECGKAVTHHTIVFTQSGAGQQTHKVYTGNTFDLLLSGTTTSLAATTHVNYAGGKTVTITC